MNKKLRITLLIIILIFVSGPIVYSQGLFKQNTTTESTTTTGNNSPGVKQLPGPGDQPPGTSPVGEGLAILSLLSGGYFMLKKKYSKK